MLFCLCMAADIAAAHLHVFSPLPKTTNEQQKEFCSSLPYFPSSYFASHMSVASSSSSVSESKRSNGSAGSSKYVMLGGRPGYQTSSKASSTTGSALHIRNRKRSAPKNKTSFQLAHPPPAVKHRQRLSIRPRLLLQLQQISDSTRPVPALDVLPSIIFAPRLAKKFPRIFKGKDGLGADDLVIVRSQTYDRSGVPESRAKKSSDEEGWNSREFVAAFCQVREGDGAVLGNTEICLNHGPTWEATSTANGAYEFTSTDERGQRTVARWVPKTLSGRRRQEYSGTSSPPGVERFNFSIINPDSRRHPVIATLTRQSVSICDRYSVPSTPTCTQAASSCGSPIMDVDAPDASCDEINTPPNTILETDEHLRTLIVITGLWVTFREGYSPNFIYHDPMFSTIAAAKAQQQTHKSHPRRSLSINLGNLGSGRAGSDNGKQKKGSQRRPEITPFSSFSAVPMLASPTGARAVPRRTQSAGTAFMNKVNNRSSSSAAKSSLQTCRGVSSPVPSHDERGGEGYSTQKHERSFPAGDPTASSKLMQRHVLIGAKREPSYRNSLATISDMQSSEDATTLVDGNGDKSGRMNKLFGFLRRTSGGRK